MGREIEHGEDLGTWGSGLLWPAAKLVAAVAAAALVAHWVLGIGGAASQIDDVDAMRAASPDAEAASPQIASVSGEYSVRSDRDGHFIIDADVNGESVAFLVDTGASTLVLSRDDAARLGLNTHALSYSERYQTANGVALGAPVTLREFRVGSFSLYDVKATVLAGPMPYSLLGMSVLSRFSGHEVEGDKLVLRW